ncbi:MAG: PaaI family thioesterase [Candidatus Eremiobacteraeota bacterium]|nr:PaaI family thioesterase [Candidatus Eremiobacteraeota bacterium]
MPEEPLAPGLLMAPYDRELPPIDAALDIAIRERIKSIPIFKMLGFKDVRIGKGWLECTVARNRELDGIFDSFHGGLLMTAADSAAAIVSLTVWGGEKHITTTDMNIRFLAPARSDVTLVAQAIKQGRTLIPVAANFWRDDGTLVAVAQVTYMRLNPKL